jgi:hypothetical protein
LPYHYLKTAIYEQRIKIYKKCDLLTDELVGLERLSDGHIDHTADGINSKDQADALCGALYLASKFANEYAYSYGENLDAGLEVSMEQSDSFRKTQMIADFENELQRLYFDTWAEQTQAAQLLSDKQREALQRYQNLADGIIII